MRRVPVFTVRPGNQAFPFGLHALWRAYKVCRKGKRAARDTQGYESRLPDRLVRSRDALASLRWRPSRTFSFVVSQPKAREIHASPFADRVVHHVITERLARLYEPVFIHDSFANRMGKGTHAAVERLQTFLRQACHGGTRSAFALQLDVANFFNSIHRPTLFRLLQGRLLRAVRAGQVAADEARTLQTLCRALLEGDPTVGVRQRGSARLRALVPAHKRLGALGAGRGLPIGNLTSQFFANVLLNELDQFCKHQLKARWYVRYVDDFVLLHPDAAQLRAWRERIAQFLADRLGLRLKALPEPFCVHAGPAGAAAAAPPVRGVDFLGYVVRPFYRLARRRVVRRMQVCLADYARHHVRTSAAALAVDMPLAARAALRARLESYTAHLRHAHSLRLWQRVQAQHPWLRQLFVAVPAPAEPRLGPPAWAPAEGPANLAQQHAGLCARADGAALLLQVGRCWLLVGRPVLGLQGGWPWPASLPAGRATQRPGLGPCTEWPLAALATLRRALRQAGVPHAVAQQTGHTRTGFKQRSLVARWTPISQERPSP